jgi:dipeptidyl aminopeptidase/acylaminoacyl peptidase
VLTPSLDRNVVSPTFSPDGRDVLFLLEDDRVYHLAKVPVAGGAVERLIEGQRAVTDLSVGRDGRIAVTASGAVTPGEVFAVEGHDLRPVTRQNAEWLREVRLGAVEPISVRSRDGTEIHGFMVKPPDWQAGRRYPTILRVHGGPVWQYYFDFVNLDWQVLAAHGYVVLGVNPRELGSGREVCDRNLGPVGTEGRPGRARGGGLGRGAGDRRSGPPGNRRVELRRDPDR